MVDEASYAWIAALHSKRRTPGEAQINKAAERTLHLRHCSKKATQATGRWSASTIPWTSGPLCGRSSGDMMWMDVHAGGALVLFIHSRGPAPSTAHVYSWDKCGAYYTVRTKHAMSNQIQAWRGHRNSFISISKHFKMSFGFTIHMKPILVLCYQSWLHVRLLTCRTFWKPTWIC